MEQDQNLSPAQSLAIIQSVIDDAKARFIDNGFYFILWGILVIAACLFHFFMAEAGHVHGAYYAWIAMPIVGVPIGIFYERSRKSNESVSKFASLYNTMWLAFAITLAGIIFVSIFYQLSPVPFILLLVGLMTFVSGHISELTALKISGIIFWSSAIASLFVTNNQQLLIEAGAVFLGYVIPGIMLWKRAENKHYV